MLTLIVDGNTTVLAKLVKTLEQRGHTVSGHLSAEAAWECCQAEQFPLVILARVLPGMSGPELCQKIRGLPWGVYAVVLCTTMQEKHADLLDCLAAGVSDFLPKSAHPRILDLRLTLAEQLVIQRNAQRGAEQARKVIEAELDESIRRYVALLAALDVGVVLQYADGSVGTINARAEQILGLTREQIAGSVPCDPQWALVTENGTQIPLEEQVTSQALASGEIARMPLAGVLRADGTLIWIAAHAQPLFHAGEDRPYAVVTTYRDVTAQREATYAQARRRDLLDILLDAVPDVICFKDRESRFTRINRTLADIYGLRTVDDAVGHSDFDYYPEAIARARREMEQRMMDTGQPLINQLEDASGLTGAPRWFLETKVPIRERGRVTGMVGISRDITVQKQAEEALRRSEESFRRLVDTLPVGIAITDEQGRYEQVNAAYCAVLGYQAEELVGQPFSIIMPEFDRGAMLALYARHAAVRKDITTEATLRRKDGTSLIALMRSISRVTVEGNVTFVFSLVDITERKQIEAHLAQLAHYDRLTGLPNRTLFTERLSHTLEVAARQQQCVALLFIDLDGFKATNDTYGHGVGDLLLQAIGERLIGCVRDEDIVARLAGDEFTVILQHIRNGTIAEKVARKILEELTHPLQLQQHLIQVSASIGISLFPADATDVETLLSYADAAMYMAKGTGKNRYALYASRG